MHCIREVQLKYSRPREGWSSKFYTPAAIQTSKNNHPQHNQSPNRVRFKKRLPIPIIRGTTGKSCILTKETEKSALGTALFKPSFTGPNSYYLCASFILSSQHESTAWNETMLINRNQKNLFLLTWGDTRTILMWSFICVATAKMLP